MSERSYERDAIVLAIAVGLVGITFGVLAASADLSLAKAIALSALVFTGASQYAVVSIIKDGGHPVAAVGSSLLIATRNALYGAVLSPILDRRRSRRLVAAQFVIDETTAMATAQRDLDDGRRAFWITGITLFACWNAGTAVGVLVGDSIGDTNRFGLDAAFPAAFIALLVPHLSTRRNRVAAVGGAVLAFVGIPLLPTGAPILLAALAVGPALLVPTARAERVR
jgi:4-azaleucine resistance transporter AzlC